ncbi:carbohydrate esterase family 5 protein [Biscogniauxia marginata]|nr:carbohydrate esterase family 5 protein [Biscogniauxia marginata]
MITRASFLLYLGTVLSLPTSLRTRQSWTVGWSSYELQNFGCKPVIFIFAKATYEPGNLGNTVGPPMSDGLKAAFGVENVATQGVDYYAFLETNFYPGGAPPWAIYDMQVLLSTAATCPDSKIVAGGYSQGAALTHRAIEGLQQEVKDKITAVVTFGDTQTLQDGGQIKGYPPDRTLIICNVGDIVCTGTLYTYPVHYDYVKWVPTAVTFLAEKLLEANATTPWPNGSFVFPNTTTGQPMLAPVLTLPPGSSSAPARLPLSFGTARLPANYSSVEDSHESS